MGIKSLEELRLLREQHQYRTSLRNHEDCSVEQIEILVGMATCGIAAGARETLGALTSELAEQNIQHVRVIPVACLGLCEHEPVVQVNVPSTKSVLYGKVGVKEAKEIIKNHLIGKTPVKHMMIQPK